MNIIFFYLNLRIKKNIFICLIISTQLKQCYIINHFWEDAISTFNYNHKCPSHKGIKNKIPFKVLNKVKVFCSNIRVFGCKVFYYISKIFRSKFDNSSTLGVTQIIIQDIIF